MLTTETKRHIDAARQVLVGVVPNPTSQIDQITNALIYKFMDDMDQAAIKQGDEPSFFVGSLERYGWTRLMDSRIGNQERMNLYSEALIKFSESKQLPDLFRDIFKSAFLPYRSPEVLGLFLKEINFFDYSHPEELGNAYEYLLSILGSQGGAGQFRTPRHIIDFIVAAVNPTKHDQILDPACGTGGFLVSAYKHILKQHDGLDDPEKKEKPLTPDERRNLMNHFEGYDIDPSMVRIAQVNMYLHQFKNPKIVQYDTLSMDERWNEKFDVILANPPFMSPKGGVGKHNKFSVDSSRSEVLFVDYIINHLRPKGKAGIIVPEGIIFQSGTAYKQLRKNLIENGLYAVVSLPSGVFQPYSGVKTSILFFNNELAKTSSEILFVKIGQDGFDLGATKRPISKNDLPTTLEILTHWNTGEKTENKQAIYVEKAKIAENGDYNLSIDRYRIVTDYTNTKWPMMELGKIAELVDDGDWIESKDQADSGIRLVQTGNVGIGEYIDKVGKERYISNATFNRLNCTEIFSGDVLLSRLPDPVGRTCILPKLGERAITAVDCTIFRFSNSITAKYFVFLTLSKEYQEKIDSKLSGATRQRISKGNLLEIKIPIPPLEIQGQIVTELNSYQNIITGAKQVVANWKPKIEIDPQWEKVKLPDISENYDSKRKPVTKSDRSYGEYPYYGASGVVDYVHEYIFDGDYLLISEDGANLLARNTPIAFSIIGKSWVNNHAHVLKFRDGNTQRFVEAYLNQINISDFVTGMAQPKLNQQALNNIEIPLPPIEIRKQIVEDITTECTLVESAKKLIEIYEQKIKNTIAKLWNA